jgi:SAM-dependent methyltransferase
MAVTEQLAEFLTPFAGVDRERILASTQTADGVAPVLLTDPVVTSFRRAPLDALHVVSKSIADVWRSAQSPRRVACCSASDASAGLDDVELKTVLGRHMHVEQWFGASNGSTRRVVAVGTLREENLALGFRLTDDVSAPVLAALIEALLSAPVPVAVLFVTPTCAARLLSDAPAVATLRRWLSGTPGRLGVWIDGAATAAALEDPIAVTAPVRELGGDVHCIRFENPSPLNAPDLDGFMRCARLACDMSMPVDGGAAPDGDINRVAAYTGEAPYQPQPFDLRSPWAPAAGDAWFEAPAIEIDADSVSEWWATRGRPTDEELAPLVDGARIESFLRLMRSDPDQERLYHCFRVYNPPPSAPGRRVSVLDGGVATLPRVRALTTRISDLVTSAGGRARVAGHDEFLDLARREIAARYAVTSTRSLALQGEAHEYLEQVPVCGPLRTDYADFAAFLPAELHDVLELGSGYGALAWALATRARRYVRLDLQLKMFATLRRDLEQSAVLADMHHLPFAAGSFDSVIANNVLEHLRDPLAGLREVHRILRADGRLFALIPLDALDSRYQLTAHLWKVDATGIAQALAMAGYSVERLEVVDLYALGVGGAFPSCHGFVAKVEAKRRDEGMPSRLEDQFRLSTAMPRRTDRGSRFRLSGRLVPAIREIVPFEQWPGRQVVVLGVDNEADAAEFARYGAHTTIVDSSNWRPDDGSVDLVYSFVGFDPGSAGSIACDIHRALKPGGTVVAVFRHLAGLHHLARIRAYFGDVCGLSEFGHDALLELAEDDGGRSGDAYMSAASVDEAFREFAVRSITSAHLTADALPDLQGLAYPPEFWLWLANALGRFLVLKAVK